MLLLTSFTVLLTLKLAELISVSWWIVFTPLLVQLVGMFIIGVAEQLAKP